MKVYGEGWAGWKTRKENINLLLLWRRETGGGTSSIDRV